MTTVFRDHAAAPTRGGRRRIRRLAATVLLSLVTSALGGLATAAPASAHADLVYASPADQQTFQESPKRLRLQFTEAVTPATGGMRLYDAAGKTIPTADPVHPPNDRTTVDIPLPEPLPDGRYAFAWRVVSSDSHPVAGALTFTVGVPGAAAETTVADDAGTPAAVPYGVARWLGFAALALLLGVAFFLAHAWPSGAGQPAARRLLWGGWGASIAAAVATALLYGPYLAGMSPWRALDGELVADTLGTRLGQALAIRVALLVALAPLIGYGLRRLPTASPRARIALAAGVLVTGAALAGTWTAAGHSTTGSLTTAALAADVIHLTAMAVWLGGLTVLGLALLPSRDTAKMRVAVPAYSRVAAISVAALVATGTFQAWRQVRTIPALLETSYGRLLMLKLAVVVAILALAATARAWVRRQYATQALRHTGPDPHQLYHFRRRVTQEAMLAVGVLAVTAALVAVEPAATAHGRTRTDPVPAAAAAVEQAAAIPGTVPFDAGGGPSGKGLLAFGLQPRRVGPTAVHLTVFNPDGRAMTPAEVTATLRLPAKELGPLPVTLQAAGPGHYIASTTVPLPGRWEAAITIRTTELDQTTIQIPVDVEP